jgi:hypothetical protein
MSMQDELQKKFEELRTLLHHGPSLEPLWQGLIKAIGELEQGGSGDAGLTNKITNWETRITQIEDEAKKYFAVISAVTQQIRMDIDDLKANQNAAADHLDRLSRFVGTLVSRMDYAGLPKLSVPPPIAVEHVDPPAANDAPVTEQPAPVEAPASEPAAPAPTPVLADPPGAQPSPAPAGSNQLLEG